MRIVIRGMNYTEVTMRNKGDFNETVTHWLRKKLRKKEECGVWVDGKQVATYENMEEFVLPVPIDKENPKSSFVPKPSMEDKE